MKSFISSLWYILKILLILGFPFVIMALLANVWVMETHHYQVGTIISASLAFLVYKWMLKGRKRNIFEVCRFKKLSLDKAAASLVAGIGFVFLASIIVSLIAVIFPSSMDGLEEQTAILNHWGVWIALLSTGIAVPFIEEIVFRGLIFDELERKLSIKVTIILQAFIFGAIHYMNLGQVVYGTVGGIFMGLALIWTGSIWAPILIHLGCNAFSIIAPFLGIDTFLNRYPTLTILLTVFVMLPLALGHLYENRMDFTPRINETV